MERYKVVFCDIDGTLLNSNHKITPDTIRKIQELDRVGVLFILVSARMLSGILPIQKELGIKTPIVCYSGGLILDGGQDLITSIGIDGEKALAVKEYISTTWDSICCSAYSYHDWIVDDVYDSWIVQESNITTSVPKQGQLAICLARGQPVHKFLCIGQPNIIANMSDILAEKYPWLAISRSNDTYLEIMDIAASKSNAVKLLCERYSIPVKCAVSFGDNFNDIDMLQATGIGFAMGNAPEQVKQKADRITLDNDHEGVLAGLTQLWLENHQTSLEIKLPKR